MASRNSKATIDHDEIRQWAEARGARPSTVASTGTEEEAGIIRLDFPGYTGEGTLEEISWDEWFEKFDDNNLALVYQETTAEGVPSNFNKLVSRESIDLETGEKKAPGRGARRGATTARRTTGRTGTKRAAATKRSTTGTKRSATGTRAGGTGTRSAKTGTAKRGTTQRRAGGQAKKGRVQTTREVAAKGGRASSAKRGGTSRSKKSTTSRGTTGSRSTSSRGKTTSRGRSSTRSR